MKPSFGVGFLLILRLRFAGGLAQLGERLHGMQEVRGSSPLSSTSRSKMNINFVH